MGKISIHECFMAWKAKNRKTGEINSYGVTLTYCKEK